MSVQVFRPDQPFNTQYAPLERQEFNSEGIVPGINTKSLTSAAGFGIGIGVVKVITNLALFDIGIGSVAAVTLVAVADKINNGWLRSVALLGFTVLFSIAVGVTTLWSGMIIVVITGLLPCYANPFVSKVFAKVDFNRRENRRLLAHRQVAVRGYRKALSDKSIALRLELRPVLDRLRGIVARRNAEEGVLKVGLMERLREGSIDITADNKASEISLTRLNIWKEQFVRRFPDGFSSGFVLAGESLGFFEKISTLAGGIARDLVHAKYQPEMAPLILEKITLREQIGEISYFQQTV
jgi:hypothetical protein